MLYFKSFFKERKKKEVLSVRKRERKRERKKKRWLCFCFFGWVRVCLFSISFFSLSVCFFLFFAMDNINGWTEWIDMINYGGQLIRIGGYPPAAFRAKSTN